MKFDKPTQNFWGGYWREVKNGRSFEVFNPASGEVCARVAEASRDDVQSAIDAAAVAGESWAGLAHTKRAGFLLKAADIMEERRQDFVDALVQEGGSWVGKAMFETAYSIEALRAAAAMVFHMNGEILPSEYGKLSMAVREPLGVVSVISPWNFPLLLTVRGFAVAMAIGNTIVLKPSEESPLSGGLLLAEVLEAAGLPAGVFNVVTCSRDGISGLGDELVVNPAVRGISFTGSTEVGRHIATLAGSLLKKACVELGGKDALIILDDADLGKAVNAATFGTYMHQGQICMSVERIIVHEAVADEFTRRLVANVKTLGVGDPASMDHVIGPLINEKQLENVHGQVTEAIEKGATLLTGGKFRDLFYEPTVLSGVTRDMKIFREETFGPVAALITVDDAEEAIAVANDSDYGLSAGIFTADEQHGMEVARRLETGMAHINDSSVNDEAHAPFGGVKNSGQGRQNGKASVEAFSELRWITLERGGRQYPPPFNEKI
ncbi:MAG: aldehyde dehydrogenase family protein [Gammaproteobacteria bacterium]|nr:aldehyde dehydrogenase family protein [Gammaproteobacteria bacterium]